MDVKIIVPTGSDISKIEAEYPDIYQDDTDCDGDDIYFVGKSSDEEDNERDSENEWLTYDEAIDVCGFVEGLMPEAQTLMEGSGGWAMGMLRTTDFSSHATDDETKVEWKRRSDLWHEAFKRGELSR